MSIGSIYNSKMRRYIQKNIPSAIKSLQDSTSFRNKTVAFSCSSYLFTCGRNILFNKSHHQPYKIQFYRNNYQYILGIMERTAYFLENGIKPIWVFDALKVDQLQEENNNKEEDYQDQEERQLSKFTDEAQEYYGLKTRDKQQDENLWKLLELTGLPIIRAPFKAEAQCAYLVKSGLAYAGISDDSDILSYGCSRVFTDFSVENYHYALCNQIQLEELLFCLGLKYDQFVDFSILMGRDPSSCLTRIKNMGPIAARKLLQQHKNIEGILNFITKSEKSKKKPYFFSNDFNFVAGRKYFKNPKVLNLTENDLAYKKFQPQKIRKLQSEINRGRTNRWIERLEKTQIFKNNLT